MDFLNLMYRRWIYFSTDPEVLATFFNNRFLLILLVIVLIRIKYTTYSSMWASALVNIPGTILHEMMHYIVGLVLNARPCNFTIFPRKSPDGYYVMGSVGFRNVTFYNAVPSAMAPLLLLVIGFIAVGCGVLIYKLYTLQIRDAEQYRVQAAEQQLSDTQSPATRGSIYSANGKLLAKSSVVWNIIANPSKCNQDYVAEASQKISELLNGSVSAEKIQEQLSKTNSQYRVIAKGIDMVTAQSIIDYANTKRITNGKAEGDPDAKYETVLSLYKESSSTREYPNGMYLSSVLGFCDDSGNGMYGLEKSYDEKLVGTPGRSISSENAWGYELANEESDTHAAVNGYNLNLTIDDTIQTVLETELSNAIDDYDVQNLSLIHI